MLAEVSTGKKRIPFLTCILRPLSVECILRADRLVARIRKTDHISQSFESYTGFLSTSRIIFKVLLITYKLMNGLGSKYLVHILSTHKPRRLLRSNFNDSKKLVVPVFKTKNYSARYFSNCAPRLWNDLPRKIRFSASVDIFKSHLKTYLLILKG